MRNWVDVPINGALFKQWLTEGELIFVKCVEGLPPSASFVRSWYDLGIDIVHLVYEHPSFDEVPEGSVIPQMLLTYKELSFEELAEVVNIYPPDEE